MNLTSFTASNGEIILYNGSPDLSLLDQLVLEEGDIWHSSLEQGYRNSFPEIVYQTVVYFWYANDFDNLERCVSWRINPHQFAIRKSVWDQLGGFDDDYESLVTSGLDFGFNSLRYQGSVPLHIKHLYGAKSANIKIPLKDIYTFYFKSFKSSHAFYMLIRRGFYKPSEWLAYNYSKKRYHLNNNKLKVAPRELRSITSKPKVSYVIPTMLRQDFTLNLLKDLDNQTYKPYEVIVIDATPAGQRDESIYNSKNYTFDVKFRWQTSKGSCRARNEAIDLCTGDYIIFGDDDIRIQPQFIENHLRLLQTYNAEACNGLDIRADHQKQTLVDLDKKLEALGDKRWKVGAAQSFSNANSCVSSKLVKTLVGNDINYDGGYGEDSDFGLSITKLGITVLHNPFSVNLHLKPPIGGYRFWGKQARITGKKRKQQPWELDVPVKFITPKPSPTIMYQIQKHFTERQQKEYKIKYFINYLLKPRLLELPIKLLKLPYRLMQFTRSQFYAKKMIDLGKRTK